MREGCILFCVWSVCVILYVRYKIYSVLAQVVRTKENDNFFGGGVVVWLFCFCFESVRLPLPHASLPPSTWNHSNRIKVELCACVCVFVCACTDQSQGEAAEAVDNRSLEEILGSIPPPPPPAMTNEPGAPRLMITHLVNRNFKSYAGEQILGPFHKVRPKFCLETSSFVSKLDLQSLLTLLFPQLIIISRKMS